MSTNLRVDTQSTITMVVKNKVGAPFKQTEFDIMYNEGISREGEIMALGEKTGVLTKSGNSYKYGEESIGRGYDAARQYLKENKKIGNEILTKIRKAIKDSNGFAYAGKAEAEEKPEE